MLDGKTEVSELEKECSMMEANGVLGNIEQAPSPRILNTHLVSNKKLTFKPSLFLDWAIRIRVLIS